ncbi:MAG: MATE family efflux transporter [Deltaproteobacteria bacterium]|nr:MATE family efflux transporter [Deltaproteobacteria bacterium]
MAIAQFGLTAIGLVDVAILGRASAADLGGASIGRSIGFTALALAIGAGAALEPLAAQALGANEPHVAWRAFRSSLVAALLVTLPCAVLALVATALLAPVGVDPEIVGPARAFVVAQTPGLFLAAAFFVGKTFVQANDRPRAALVGSVVANVVNVLVCSVLVLGDGALARVGLAPRGLPALGAFGAGLASTIANGVLAAFVIVPSLRLRPGADASTATSPSVKRVLALGTPIGLQLLAEIGVFSIAAVLAGKLGKVAVSAHQIAIGLASFTFMGVLGISGATAVRVGNAVGAGASPRRAGLTGIAMGAFYMMCSSALFVVFPRTLASLFTDKPEVLELGVSLLGIAAAFQIFDGVQGVAAGALRGAGDVRFPFVVNVGGHWLVGFPLALVLAFGLGLGARGLWWGLLAGLVVVAVLLLGRFVVITRKAITRV